MARILKNESTKMGAAPGSLIFVGKKRTETVTISAVYYNPEDHMVYEDVKPEEMKSLLRPEGVTWFNVIGLHDIDIIKSVGDQFDIHPLFMEDLLNTAQRPKFELFENHNTFVFKMLRINEKKRKVEFEQISVVAGSNYLISFQEQKGDVFDAIRERIIRPTTRIRHRGSDYLAFALLDAVVDNYILCIEFFGNMIEQLEDDLLQNVENEHINQINLYKREINTLRRIIRPMVEVASQYSKSESNLIARNTAPFLKDLEDHTSQAAEAIEIYKELLNDEMDQYYTAMNNRLNDTIRVLTIFSVVFIPLTFLAGIYGTNFKYLPELEYKYSYPIFWGVMILTALGMLYYFRRKKWL